MASKRKKKRNTGFWSGLNSKGRMYFVLAVCCALVLVTVIIAFVAVHGLSSGGTDTQDTAGTELVEEQGYNKDENTIDASQYSSTILEESEDAGQEYVDETLFLGDSNTARMRMFGYCTLENSLASVGMSARSLASYECVKFSGISGYVTMPEAVGIMQPRRVIITFGTNDLSPGYSTEDFIANYQEGIEAVEEAYPSVDIIINAIPPLGQQHSNENLTQTQVDQYNQALVQMCQEQGWKFLNSAEVLKDSSTGYAKSGYVISSDGIHLTEEAVGVLFDYIRTHSYITEDDRPTLTSIPEHVSDKDVSASTAASVITSSPAASAPASSSSETEEEESQSEYVEPTQAPTATPAPTEAPATATPAPTAAPTPAPTQAPTPTPTVAPTPEPTPAPTPEPTQAPTEPPAPTDPPASDPPAQSDAGTEPTGEETI
ncbi:SGNH/GDSL hydrolase family protein [uncultured Subdoligranulum sp.]|uniref:SGNH/GDSL hydrolase family protein n=1 Tax=uncultured Subdoligranulum sp. TaxID=512298 RepID=UPI0025FB24D7|nr:SGNH/GDSL hydrolase family protein [uncultured Subdoligranulum sp.]